MRFFLALLAGTLLAHADPHPRLLFLPTAEAELKERIAKDELMARMQQHAVKKAEAVIGQRTCEYLIPDGKRLLAESRRALEQVIYSAWAWRTTGEERFKERTIRELDAACALKDWNPSHFLDTAEMATAVAVGYDWLYPALKPEQRQRYEDALLEKALREVGKRHGKTRWWLGATNNWTEVCACGMGLAAEAVRERDPEVCAGIIERAKDLIAKSGKFYEPDGVYPEGPSYWHYGTNFHVLLIAARQALGQPVEVSPLLRKSGDFMIQIHGPTRQTFNFADSGPGKEVISPARSWIARHFKDAGQIRYVRELIEKELDHGGANWRTYPMHLLWLPEAPPDEAKSVGPPLQAHFGGEQAMAFMRNGWGKDAAWLAIKGGTGAASHGHLDAGSFIYEAAGVRWFHDIGSDDYNMPAYFGAKRWSYLRLNNFSHNTLVIDGKLQAAPKEGCEVSAEPGVAMVKLDQAYGGQAAAVLRTAHFKPEDGSVRLLDSVAKPAGPVRWGAVTKAAVKIEGPRVILEEAGKRLVIERLKPEGAAWEEYSLKPDSEKENQNEGYRMIGFMAPVDSLALEVKWWVEK